MTQELLCSSVCESRKRKEKESDTQKREKSGENVLHADYSLITLQTEL